MPRFKITVTEMEDAPAASTDHPTPRFIETEVFKLVVDQFDAVSFTKAITAQPRRRRKSSKTGE